MSDQPSKTGLYVSGALHAALLAFIVIGFAAAPKFDDATESIPVDTVTQSQFNEIMKGERDAKPVKEPPVEPTRQTATAEPPAVPTPPEPPPELKTADEPPPPPPPKPEPPKPEPPTPAPPPKPVAEEAPSPPVKPKPAPPEKPKPDQLAKLVEKSKADEPPKPKKAYDPNAIAKLIGQSKSSADPTPTGAATPLGLPDQHAARMSPSLSAGLDAWLTEAYLNCWTPPPTMPEGERYVAEVRVAFNADGTLASPPTLVNPPTDPAWRAHAESAMRAVLKCNPLHIPPQYAPYFEQWRTKTVHFDPQSALG
ncbi:MAG TPA: cell envelope biogenesis protein TolA [Roseiarcus sp.]|nr:cell envelope biogenesis protein TolA [Roseiarcus sp.]